MCWQEVYGIEGLIRAEDYILFPRKRMTQNCCSPLCDNWDECEAVGFIDYMKIVIQDPRKEVKDWCPSLSLQNLPSIEGESQREQ